MLHDTADHYPSVCPTRISPIPKQRNYTIKHGASGFSIPRDCSTVQNVVDRHAGADSGGRTTPVSVSVPSTTCTRSQRTVGTMSIACPSPYTRLPCVPNFRWVARPLIESLQTLALRISSFQSAATPRRSQARAHTKLPRVYIAPPKNQGSWANRKQPSVD